MTTNIAMGTEAAKQVGVWAGAVIAVVTVVKILWSGLRALLHAQEMVKNMERQVMEMERLQSDMSTCLEQAKALNRDMGKTEQRLEKLEDRVWNSQLHD